MQLLHYFPSTSSLLSPSFRNWALFARLAFLHDHGGQFPDGCWAVADAGGGCAVPQLAWLGWLAGPADRHHQPFRSDAALHLVSLSLGERIPLEGGRKQCSLSAFVCHHSLLSLLICSHPCRLFPESLRWLLATQHYRRSKAMMLRIARKNQVDMTTESNGVLAGEENSKKKKMRKIQQSSALSWPDVQYLSSPPI